MDVLELTHIHTLSVRPSVARVHHQNHACACAPTTRFCTRSAGMCTYSLSGTIIWRWAVAANVCVCAHSHALAHHVLLREAPPPPRAAARCRQRAVRLAYTLTREFTIDWREIYAGRADSLRDAVHALRGPFCGVSFGSRSARTRIAKCTRFS